MKKTIKFSKLFGLMVVVSCALVISGIVGLFTKGINFGIDFQAGFIEKVRFAPSAFILTYSGEKNIQVAQNSQGIDITVISVDTENKVVSFKYTEYPTVGQFIEAIQQQIDGVKVKALARPIPHCKACLLPQKHLALRRSHSVRIIFPSKYNRSMPMRCVMHLLPSLRFQYSKLVNHVTACSKFGYLITAHTPMQTLNCGL